MKKTLNRSIRIIALCIACILIISAFTFQMPKNQPFSSAVEPLDDMKTAADISNMTGAALEHVMKLRNDGNTWNQVLDKLSSQKAHVDDNDGERNQRLLKSGLDEAVIAQLKDEGHSEEAIIETTLLIQRILYQLDEIVGQPLLYNSDDANSPVENRNNEEDIESYKQLKKKIDAETAVKAMLKLEKELGSFQAVLDEYLYALQVDLDINLLIIDKEEYEHQKANKNLALDSIITLMKIEQKMLETLNHQPEESVQLEEQVKPYAQVNTEPLNPLPEAPALQVEELSVKDPLDAIMNEIQAINPNN